MVLPRIFAPLLFLFFVHTASAQFSGAWEQFTPTNSGLSVTSVGLLIADSSGGVWAAGPRYDGIDHYNGSTSTWRHDLEKASIQSAVADRTGGLKVFANGEPKEWDGTQWKTVGNGGFNEVFHVAADSKGRLWTVLEPDLTGLDYTGAVVAGYYGFKWSAVVLPIRTGISALTVGPGDSVWTGTRGNGIYIVKGSNTITVTAGPDALPSDTVTTLAVDADGAIWVGTDNGLARYAEGRWSRINAEEAGLPDAYVRTLVADRDGGVWVVTGRRTVWGTSTNNPPIARIEGSARTRSLTPPFPTSRIHAMTIDLAGRLWFAVGDSGLIRYNEASVSAVNAEGPSIMKVEVRPNPFAGASTITLTLPSTAHVTVDVIDSRGAQVRRTTDSDFPAGTGAVTWDGTDQTGTPVAAGLYYGLIRIDAEHHVVTMVKAE